MADWSEGWQNRLLAEVTSRGYPSLIDFLRASPGLPYLELSSRFASSVAAMQISRLQFEGAVTESEARWAARDSLARTVNDRFPNGWRIGDKPDYDQAGTFADWCTLIEVDAMHLPQAVHYAERVWEKLQQLDIPPGWQPSGPDDPIIVRAFDEGWPVGSGKK